MSRPFIISSSILASDFSKLGQEVIDVLEAGSDWVHIDVMDGHFVPNITFGPDIVKTIRPLTDAVFDTHLMIAPCDSYLEAFAQAGSDIITIHAEAGPHLQRSLQTIRALGKKAGVAMTPASPETIIEYVLDDIDLILIMTVNPGFSGQKFISAMLNKICRVKLLVDNRPIDIAVDGGVTVETASWVSQAGANVLVAGSTVYTGRSLDAYRTNIDALRTAILEKK